MRPGLGLLLLVTAGVMNASFTIPMKWTRRWAWENTWLLWAILALAAFPTTLLALTVPNSWQIYRQIGTKPVAVIAACGIGLGLCQVCFGLAVDMIGVSLTFAIASGVAAAVGSVAPLLLLHREHAFTKSGAALFLGVILIGCGVWFCSEAGRRREAALHIVRGSHRAQMIKGLILAVTSGVTAASMNVGFDYGAQAIAVATHMGISSLWTTNIVWAPMLLAASIPNIVYCLYLLRKHQTSPLFRGTGTHAYWLASVLMAFLWFGGIIFYGLSILQLGTLGAVFGWPLLESIIVITASVLGLLAGEWQGSGRRPLRLQFEGVAILIVAVFVLSAATR